MFNKINNFININLYDFNKYINNLLLILKLFINIFTIVFTLFFTSVLYISIDIKMFVLLIFLILILSNFIIYYKYNILTVYNKYIVIILNKDYSFLLKKIVMIKFILLYLYVVENVSWCDSSFTRIAHDIFMSMGTKVGMEPKTTVSTLETIGMFTICGGIAYGSIKGYQHFTGTGPKSINERFDLLEQKINQNNTVTQTKLNNITTKLEQTREDLVTLTIEIDNHQIERFALVELGFKTMENKINIIDNKVNDLTERIEQNQNSINKIIKDEISLKLQKIETLTQTQKHILERNTENISSFDRSLLQNLYNEVGEIVQEGNKLADNIPKSIPQLQPNIIQYLPNAIRSNLRQSSLQQNEVLKQTYITRSNSEHLELDHLLTPTSTIPSTSIVSSLPINKSFKISEITDTKIVFTAIGSSVNDLTMGVINNASKHLFNLPVNDYVIKIIYNGLGQVLSNTLSGIAFTEILKLLNIGSNIPTITTSQNVGSVLSSTLREFVNGLKQGWRK